MVVHIIVLCCVILITISDHEISAVNIDTIGEFGDNIALLSCIIILLIEQQKHSQIFLEILICT